MRTVSKTLSVNHNSPAGAQNLRQAFKSIKLFCEEMDSFECTLRGWMNGVRTHASGVRWNEKADVSSFQATYSRQELILAGLAKTQASGYGKEIVSELTAVVERMREGGNWYASNSSLDALAAVAIKMGCQLCAAFLSKKSPGRLVAEFDRAHSTWKKLQLVMDGGDTSLLFNNARSYPEHMDSKPSSIYIPLLAKGAGVVYRNEFTLVFGPKKSGVGTEAPR